MQHLGPVNFHCMKQKWTFSKISFMFHRLRKKKKNKGLEPHKGDFHFWMNFKIMLNLI